MSILLRGEEPHALSMLLEIKRLNRRSHLHYMRPLKFRNKLICSTWNPAWRIPIFQPMNVSAHFSKCLSRIASLKASFVQHALTKWQQTLHFRKNFFEWGEYFFNRTRSKPRDTQISIRRIYKSRQHRNTFDNALNTSENILTIFKIIKTFWPLFVT